MSKITNDGLTRSGTGCHSCTHMTTVGVKGLSLHVRGYQLLMTMVFVTQILRIFDVAKISRSLQRRMPIQLLSWWNSEVIRARLSNLTVQ